VIGRVLDNEEESAAKHEEELDREIGVIGGNLGADESKKELPEELESHDRSWER